jgi:hypothetical protein
VPMTAAHAVKRTLPEATRPAPTRPFAWLSKCRGILVRYDKKDMNYLGLIQFACALYWYRRLDRLARSNANQSPT